MSLLKAPRFGPPLVLGVVGVLLFFGIWDAIFRIGLVRTTLIPTPAAVTAAAYSLMESGELFRHIYASLWRAAMGFFFGATTGILVGVATARISVFNHMTGPLLQMFRAIPSIAFVPLALFWFGIGEVSKVFLIAWGVFFPVWVSTFLGVRDFSPLLQRAGASLGARSWRMLLSVILPGALPLILAGLRVSLAVAFVLLVAAELSGAAEGVGYFIQLSSLVWRVDQMFVGLLTLGLMGFLADFFFVRLVRYLFPWYGAEERSSSRN
jgi:ABC-type nitrate/sulfonate/bicarbonate transport system permease component